ncbi:succinyl-diaminopimelate desuccinylase [Candidatus Marinamargulisbacteria bacterium SCGC AAA071-K20]|nr:succinyl-diaminopimelate desuccinylase [Candidatus Marinamargulisbacteria bacterium SCGC AAA071-K20]
MIDFITSLLAIESKTYHEKNCVDTIQKWVEEECPGASILREGNNLVISNSLEAKPHIALVGHSDTVPDFFIPRQEGENLHASGASDMKAAVGVFLWLFKEIYNSVNYKLSVIVYDKEEQTPVTSNGLYELIKFHETTIKSIDCAIVGEPTNNTVQIGCVGSLHYSLKVLGKSCHSARPWNGENALYNAFPIISYFSELQPQKETIFGVDFYDVFQLTESQSEPGRTSVPGWWEANINYRFSPNKTESEAQKILKNHVAQFTDIKTELVLKDSVFPGDVIETDLFNSIVKLLNKPLEAKQAWTDVAQLTRLKIPAFNYGPGLQAQAHKVDEYISIPDINEYYHDLKICLEGLLK